MAVKQVSLCQQTFGCARQADCPDHRCPGRLEAFNRATEHFWSDEAQDTPIASPYELGDLARSVFFVIGAVLSAPLVAGLLAWLYYTWPIQLVIAQLF